MRALAVLLVADRMARVAGIGGGKMESEFHSYDTAGEAECHVDLANSATITVDGAAYQFSDLPDQSSRLFEGNINGQAARIQYQRKAETVHLMMGYDVLSVLVLPARMAEAQALMPIPDTTEGAKQVVAPMPGLLTKLLVAVGDTVNAGDDVAIIEAMKMENLLKADAGGVVAEIHAAEGENLMVDQPILSFADDSDDG
jgi:propionyl-CoA carboxylase alpha chain